MKSRQNPSRRSFLGTSVGALAGAGLIARSMPPVAEAEERPVATEARRIRNRVGAVAYSYQYSIGLFSYKDRPNEKFDTLEFVEATHKAGGEVAQLYYTQIRDLIKSVNSPNVGVLFDVGNILGTLDDPTEAADILGPLTVATHYKDFAIEEVARGFRFCMVPLGCGSLRLREVTERLLKHVDSDMGMSIEMINGQHFELNWLEDRFWTAYRNKTARQLAATLRHVRGKAIDIDQYKLIEEVDKLPHKEHMQYEQDRMAQCIAYLKGMLDDLEL